MIYMPDMGYKSRLVGADAFNATYAYAVNVISKEQLDAYGNYDTAHGAIKAGPIYLDTFVSTDGDRPFVECGHS